jgi:hypothetical protein
MAELVEIPPDSALRQTAEAVVAMSILTEKTEVLEAVLVEAQPDKPEDRRLKQVQGLALLVETRVRVRLEQAEVVLAKLDQLTTL